MTFNPRKSFIGLFIENYDALIERVRWRLKNLQHVDDVVQDTFLKLQSIPQEREIDNPRSYIFRIADNLAMDRLRKDKLETRFFTDDDGEQSRDATPSPEIQTDYRQRLERLSRIIDTLPPRQRQAFVLHKFEGLSHAEVARTMDISTSAVEKLIMKALLACRTQMDDLLDHEK